MITTIYFLLFAVAGLLIGIWITRAKSITVSDSFKPKKDRTERQIQCDAVMQLQNEIVNSGALKIKEMPNGDLSVKLKILR